MVFQNREHDVPVFSNIVKNIEVDVFFSKNRLQIASLRMGKHCIGKKSEHRPSLQLSNECCQDHILTKNIWFVWFGTS